MAANYISFQNLPVYFSTTADNGSATTPTESSNDAAIATQVQFNFPSNVAPTRILGKKSQKNEFLLAGPPNSTFSFSAYIRDTSEFIPTDFTGGKALNVGASVRFGDQDNGIKLSGCYMTNYSFTLSPYSPVLVQCDFVSYNPFGNVPSSQTGIGNMRAASAANDAVLPTIADSDFAHGAYSDVNGLGILTGLGSIESIQYQYSVNRQPLYAIGTEHITGTEIISEEQSITVAGDNIMPLIKHTGFNPGNITGSLRNADSDICMSFAVDGRLTANNISVTAGDVARGSVTVQELLR